MTAVFGHSRKSSIAGTGLFKGISDSYIKYLLLKPHFVTGVTGGIFFKKWCEAAHIFQRKFRRIKIKSIIMRKIHLGMHPQ